ncbi:porin, partial [Oricola sp.]|uniref:porin n=1 Tax=Oricola sp. TaxID=1979950 RepID=UPI0025F06785
VAVSGARAADAVIIPEPEVVEYVRVCDAAGTGYFYIPGTETCLKIGGYVRFQIDHVSYNDHEDYDDEYGDDAWADFTTKLSLKVSSWTDSEIGAVETFYEAVSSDGGSLSMDSAYLSFAGLKMGYFGGFLDNGINGETDTSLLNDKFNTIQYTGTAGAVSFGVAIDQIHDTVWNNWEDEMKFGITGMVGFSAGAVDATITGFYDLYTEGHGVIGRVSTDLGMGTLQARAIWQSNDWTGYGGQFWFEDYDFDVRQWSAEVSYAANVSDKLTLTPGFSYHRSYGDDTVWIAGLTADYAITDTLAVKANVEYLDYSDDWDSDDDWSAWSSFLRFQASF